MQNLYLYQHLDCVAINLFKIENKSVEVEQLLQALELQFSNNFTYVVSVKYPTS